MQYAHLAIQGSRFVEDGEGAGEAEAGGAGVGVGLGAVLDGTGAEHFALGLELGVNFEADGDDVLGHGTMGKAES